MTGTDRPKPSLFKVRPRWLVIALLSMLAAGLAVYGVRATYGHPIVAFNGNPVRITFPRAGRIVLWNDVRSSNGGYFARYYFIRGGCTVGVNCAYLDVNNNQTVLTNLTVAAGETIDVKGCDCYGGNCGTGGCQYPHVGWKTSHHNYFCPSYFETNTYVPAKGGKDFTSLWNAFAASGDTLVAGPQCWGDWDEDNSNGGYDHDFEDFLLIFAYRDTFTGYHDGNSGDVSSSGCLASGWLKQNELTNKDVYVRVLSDGSQVTAGWANRYRSDLGSQCSGGTCAFSLNLWGLIASNISHTIRVQGQNPYSSAWFDLGNTPKNIRCLAAPTVDLRIDGSNGPITRSAPAAYTLSWTGTGVGTTCTAAGSWSGGKSLNGSHPLSGITTGTYTYSLTCTNSQGSASDSVSASVVALPTVDVKVDGEDGPVTRSSPASYAISWTSTGATLCSGSARLTGLGGLTGLKNYSGVVAGSYDYTMTCQNAAGSPVTDMARVAVVSLLAGSISPTYAKLLLFAPSLGQPAQTLFGTASGGDPPYEVTVGIRSPSGMVETHTRSGSTWSLFPEDAGDVNLGVTENGVWTAWADIRDLGGQTYRTGSVTWSVSWYPVHGMP